MKPIVRLRSLLLVMLLLNGVPAISAENDPRSSSEFYRGAFGVVDPLEFPLAFRVSSIFSRLLRVVDRAEYKDPRILVVDSDNWPWAIALPDNTVVLSRGAVELCYEGVDTEHGDTRLAMILGHELGHLAEDDYWHRDVYLSLNDQASEGSSEVLKFIGQRSGLVDTGSDQWKAIARDRELKADDRGFLYSSLAGFEPADLIHEKDQSFFSYWIDQTTGGKTANSEQDPFHLTPDDRAAYIQARIGTLSNIALLYHLGVALVQLNNLDDAEKMFRKVLVVFPSHEVYNNLGVIKLMAGVGNLPLDAVAPYWFPVMLDASPETPALTRGIGNGADQAAAELNLQQAADYFEQAVKQNPSYIQAYINLASASFYQSKYAKALSTINEALEIAPGNDELQALQQLAMLESLAGNIDYLPNAIAKFEAMMKSGDIPISLQFNLAQLYEQAGHAEKAEHYWQQVALNKENVPESLRPMLEIKTGAFIDASGDEIDAALLNYTKKFQQQSEQGVQLATNVGALRKPSISVENQLLKISQITPTTVEYSLDSQALISVSTGQGNQTARELLNCCGKPRSRQLTNLGEVWSYGDDWAMLVRGNTVREVWRNLKSPGIDR